MFKNENSIACDFKKPLNCVKVWGFFPLSKLLGGGANVELLISHI